VSAAGLVVVDDVADDVVVVVVVVDVVAVFLPLRRSPTGDSSLEP